MSSRRLFEVGTVQRAPSAVVVSPFPPYAFNTRYNVDTYLIKAVTIPQAERDILRLMVTPGAPILRLRTPDGSPLDSAIQQIVEDIAKDEGVGWTRKIVWVPSRGSYYQTKNNLRVRWVRDDKLRSYPLKAYVNDHSTPTRPIEPLTDKVVDVLEVDDVLDVVKFTELPVRGDSTYPLQVSKASLTRDPTMWRRLWDLKDDRLEQFLVTAGSAISVSAPSLFRPAIDSYLTLKEESFGLNWNKKLRKWNWILQKARLALQGSDPDNIVDKWVRECVPSWVYENSEINKRQRLVYLGEVKEELYTTFWTAFASAPTEEELNEQLTKTKFFVISRDSVGKYKLLPFVAAYWQEGGKFKVRFHPPDIVEALADKDTKSRTFTVLKIIAEYAAAVDSSPTAIPIDEQRDKVSNASTGLINAIANARFAIEDYPENLKGFAPYSEDISTEATKLEKEAKASLAAKPDYTKTKLRTFVAAAFGLGAAAYAFL